MIDHRRRSSRTGFRDRERPGTRGHPFASGVQHFRNDPPDVRGVDAAVWLVARNYQRAVRSATFIMRQNPVSPVPGELFLPAAAVVRDMEHAAVLPVEVLARLGVFDGEVGILRHAVDCERLFVAILYALIAQMVGDDHLRLRSYHLTTRGTVNEVFLVKAAVDDDR